MAYFIINHGLKTKKTKGVRVQPFSALISEENSINILYFGEGAAL